MKQPDLGKKIAELRKAKGLTQEELVEKCNLSVRTLQRIEAGEVTPRSYTIKIIFATLDYKVYDSPESLSDRFGKAGFLIFKWLGQFYKYVFDLFNLKTNTMKKITILSISLFLIGFGLFILTAKSDAQSIEKVQKVIAESSRDYVRWFNNGLVDSLLTLYRDDACVLPVGCGKADNREFFQSQLTKGFKFKEINTISVNVCDTVAVEKGSWTIRFDSGLELHGMYLTEWHFANKKWLIVNDISNSR